MISLEDFKKHPKYIIVVRNFNLRIKSRIELYLRTFVLILFYDLIICVIFDDEFNLTNIS